MQVAQQIGHSGLGVPATVLMHSNGRVQGYRVCPFGKRLPFNVKVDALGNFKIGSGTGTARFRLS